METDTNDGLIAVGIFAIFVAFVLKHGKNNNNNMALEVNTYECVDRVLDYSCILEEVQLHGPTKKETPIKFNTFLGETEDRDTSEDPLPMQDEPENDEWEILEIS